VSKHSVFVTPPNGEQTPLRQPSYLFPLACIDAIMNMAEMLAVLNESWKRDNCLDEKELLREGMEYAQLDFDRPQPPLVYWTDDEPRYQRIFAVAYARRYRDLVRERRAGGQSEGCNAY
jgi:hypothetical protein